MGPGSLLLLGLALIGLLLAVFWPRGGLLARVRTGARLSRRILIEDALKYAYKSEARGEVVRLDSLAGALSVSRNRVARLIEEMTDEELVRFEGQGFRLTQSGREAALHVIRAHRLWEHYLSEETGFSEDEWHDRAEVQEHVLSPDATDALARRLGNPVFDPHGDPIPGPSGKDPVRSPGFSLSRAPAGAILKITHVEDEPGVVYAQLVAEGLYPGTELQVIDAAPERIRFWANGEAHTLAPVVAGNVSVVELERPREQDAFAGSEPLSGLSLGEGATVVGIAASCRGAERRRLLDLGLVPGTAVSAEMTSPSGDPTAYRVRETLVALREKQAQHIRVRRHHGP
jgi:DtxR family Mn-dependent transcriptional regulator